MGKETSGFDEWIRNVGAGIKNLTLVDSLNALAVSARERFGARVWFVEILGRRWSYMAGEMPEQPPESDTRRIELKGSIGLFYG